MRDYAKVAPTFWSGETGRAIVQAGPVPITCAFYLMTSPHSNAMGLYYLPLPYVGFDLNLPIEAVQEALAVCVRAGFCSYDPTSAYVWVYEMAHYQTGAKLTPKDNRHKAMVKLYVGLTKNPYMGAFFDRYGEAYQLPRRRSGTTFSEVLKACSIPPSKGLQNPLETSSEGGDNSDNALQSPQEGPITISKPLPSPLEAPFKPETEAEAETETEVNSPAGHARRLASLLLDLIRERNPNFKQPAFDRWVQDIERAIRLDKRNPEQLEAIIRFAQADDFWCGNILSGAKVREQFDQLWMKLSAKQNKERTRGKRALMQPTTLAQARQADRDANAALVLEIINAEQQSFTPGNPGDPGQAKLDLLPAQKPTGTDGLG